jgi:hypothetical protein
MSSLTGKRNLSPIERFNLSYVEEVNTGCWNWLADHNRYGHLKVNGKYVAAHRFAYKHFNGEIPEKMLVCHKCDNSLCVNPNHLFLGTYKDNHNDMVAKNRRASFVGEKNGRSKLTAIQAKEIKDDLRPYREIAKQYNVSHTIVGLIKKGKVWNG